MMPPHTSGFVPQDGDVHVGNELRIEGYTLKYADEEPELIDVATGEAVAISTELEQTRHDRGTGQPGSVQYSGVLTITAPDLVPGRTYRLSFLGDSVTFTSA